MSLEPAFVRKMPLARELFQQWKSNRAARTEGSNRLPFRRDWEKLLQDAGLLSADDRREALRDVEYLEGDRLALAMRENGRAYQVLSLRIPLEAEARWREIFADELPAPGAPFDASAIEWAPELAFVPGARLGTAPEDLLRLNRFLQDCKARPRSEAVPLKERSLEIFGDEKRLDALLGTTLFAPGRLTLAHLACFSVAEPLAWLRGTPASETVLVLENLATFESFARWNGAAGEFAAVVYGGGNRFVDSVTRLPEIFAQLGGPKRILYFGDLDAAGLRIPRRAAAAARAASVPAIEPDRRAYTWLLERGDALPPSSSPYEPATEEDLSWLGELRDPAAALLARCGRVPQEIIGWDFLHRLL